MVAVARARGVGWDVGLLVVSGVSVPVLVH